MKHRDLFLEGITLFNTGHYWHAHEAWETCWKDAYGIEALFYKGLIQSAAALVKWQQGNRRGLQLNWEKSKRHLQQLSTPIHGVDCALFLECMQHFVTSVASDGTITPPRITLATVDEQLRQRNC